MIRRISVALATALVVFAAGCSTNTDLGGVKLPNGRPDTRITGQPPTLLEAGFAVDLNWTGSDPDGRIVGYEWKISNNGPDGISPRDTLTVDPLTGAVLHPWRFTAANDTTFLVLADQPDFPGDDHSRPRSYRTHSVFIRAVDDKGAVDPTPAYISFTSTTIVPTCRVVYPNLGNRGSKNVPPSVNIGWLGVDSDFDLKVPTQVRYLWKSAQYDTTADGIPRYIRTPFEYDLHWDKVINFDDPEWSEWRGYASTEFERRVQFPNQPNLEYFLFALQVRDTAGAVSVGHGYQIEVGNFRITRGGFFPAVTLVEPFLGSTNSSQNYEPIAGGQPLNFSWTATAESYNGEITSYRHGWDLVDPEDPSDPGWAVPPGLSKQNLFAAEQSFDEGNHVFFLRVEDDSQQVRLITYTLDVIPFVSRDSQFELFLIDEVIDPANLTNNWLDEAGRPRNSEVYRDAYWHFLAEGAGGVAGMNWERDWSPHTKEVGFRDLVQYKAVLCYAQSSDQQLMFSDFRPRSGVDQFVWVTPYQRRGGNFFLVGGSSMESFIESFPNYMVPIIFDSRQQFFSVDGNTYITGFGFAEQPDGTFVQRGPRMYPYATAGIAALDWTSSNTKTIYGENITSKFQRKSDCVGLKAVTLDPIFKTNHGIGPGVVADTMLTNKIIDWPDEANARGDTLGLFNGSFPFRNDEFYDVNISSRAEPVILHECEALEAPDGLCVEPMFRGISRMDWMREIFYAKGDMEWPQSTYIDYDLTQGCGAFGLTSYEGRDRSSSTTNGLTYGFMSYKMIEDKPVRRADVYWGFDPYRFDEEDSKTAIRWVLQYFGLSINP
ncbi:MAG: hypothetical protein ABFS42_09570 [Candidatus Krumholzibacteriota bacterium]